MQRVRTLDVIRTTPHLRAALSAVRCAAPDAWIGAGCLRNAVWDAAHGWTPALPVDVDVVFLAFDDAGFAEQDLERRLRRLAPALPWEARNQARMHRRHGHDPYSDLATAVSHWVETATAVIAREIAPDRYEICAPHGLGDLERLVVRPVPSQGVDAFCFEQRLARKGWLARWPGLQVVRAPAPRVS